MNGAAVQGERTAARSHAPALDRAAPDVAPLPLADHRPVAIAQRRLRETLDDSPGVTAHRALARRLNAAPPVTQLAALSASLSLRATMRPGPSTVPRLGNGQGVVQAMMADDQDAAPQAPAFQVADLLYASRGPDAVDAGERSLYFGNGRRIRLMHDAGPHISERQMDRFTFRQDNTGREYDEDDYRRIVNSGGDANAIQQGLQGILTPAQIGNPGRLFEIAAGEAGDPEARTHGSRGSPTAEQGIVSQQHLDAIVAIATEADGVLPAMEDAWEDARETYRDSQDRVDRRRRTYRHARADYDEADEIYERAQQRVRALSRDRRATPREIAEAENILDRAERSRDRRNDRLDTAEEDLEDARQQRDADEQVYRNLKQQWEARVAAFNERIRVAYAAAVAAVAAAAQQAAAAAQQNAQPVANANVNANANPAPNANAQPNANANAQPNADAPVAR